ncbi:LppX_LprAFG lipoprotein [Nocardioides bruguierae]|uniref:LppX_LprAFG lipoprotein n=1 Tax=Nocardioides bruguierae TaxID=2945102 RepID=A0A9X2D434_9ACTN|nr:LppX_LprAFG lipoprotein [Nocardioides bruguierae]MCM0618796.1 LppX_LprAFG lipoprotein [Nocardioides bruguierae]
MAPHHTRPARAAASRASALALTGACLLAAVGCSSAESEELSPREAVDAAADTLTATAGVRVAISTDAPPSGVSALVGAEGTLTAAPAFDGSITITYAGLEPQVPVVAVDDTVYAQLPLTTGWTAIDPADYGAPDPSLLLDADAGVPALLRATTDLAAGSSQRGGTDNSEVLTPYTGTVAGEAVGAVVGSGGAPEGDVDVTYLITEDGELRSAEVTGEFYGAAATTYVLDLDSYGEAPEITAPQ